MPKRHHIVIALLTLLPLLMSATPAAPAEAPRARDLGIPFEGTPGPLNAITDVAGVEVGHVTLIEGDGALEVGVGPVRTGVTAIHPRGKDSTDPVFAGWFTLNASGEMTGTTWLEERGLVDGPMSITNTHSVGVVRDASVAWMVEHGWPAQWHAPVVAETYDGALNDINGFHVTREHALDAMATATGGPVLEGAVGGGTGMVCNGFKGGIGTASRTFDALDNRFTVGVLVQCNYNFTGDGLRLVFIAFSTANPGLISENERSELAMYPNNALSLAFAAAVQATEEAVVNALVAADTVIGVSGLRVSELPEDQVRAIFSDQE